VFASLSAHTAHGLLSPSARILVAAALPTATDVDTLPWEQVHWPTLVSLTAYERAETSVSRLLRRAPSWVPEEVRLAIRGLDRVAQFRSAAFEDAAGSAVDALAAAQVPVLWLKGAALAMQSSAGFGLRGMGDLDLLVAPADHVRAREALTRAGWSSPVVEGYEHHHHDAPMLRPGGLRLELHTSLFPPDHPFTDDYAGVWLARGVEVGWGHRRVRVLPQPWHVVHASTHWTWSHEGTVGSWQYLHDMQRLTAGWAMDGTEWEAVVTNAREMGASLPVGWGVWSAHCVTGLELSQHVVDRLRGRRSLLDGLAERQWVLAAFRSPAGSPSVRWSRFWWRRAMRGLGDAGGRWPWAVGRAAQLSPQSDPQTIAGDAPRDRLEQWQRHLARVVRSW